MHGLIPYIDALADPLAAAGYVALAPALYSRLGTLATDAGGPPTAVAGMLVRQTSNPQVLDDLRGALNYSADYPAVGGATVGAIGFCAGGRSGLFLAAAGPRLRAFVAMHPTLTDETPSSMHPTAVCDVIPAVRCPVHAAIATSRPWTCTSNGCAACCGRMAATTSTTCTPYHLYAGERHGFCHEGSTSYQPAVAAARSVAGRREGGGRGHWVVGGAPAVGEGPLRHDSPDATHQ